MVRLFNTIKPTLNFNLIKKHKIFVFFSWFIKALSSYIFLQYNIKDISFFFKKFFSYPTLFLKNSFIFQTTLFIGYFVFFKLFSLSIILNIYHLTYKNSLRLISLNFYKKASYKPLSAVNLYFFKLLKSRSSIFFDSEKIIIRFLLIFFYLFDRSYMGWSSKLKGLFADVLLVTSFFPSFMSKVFNPLFIFFRINLIYSSFFKLNFSSNNTVKKPFNFGYLLNLTSESNSIFLFQNNAGYYDCNF